MIYYESVVKYNENTVNLQQYRTYHNGLMSKCNDKLHIVYQLLINMKIKA